MYVHAIVSIARNCFLIRVHTYRIQTESLKSADCGRREPNSIKTVRMRRNILVRRHTPAHGPRSRSGNTREDPAAPLVHRVAVHTT